MKNNTDNKDMQDFAEESTYKVAESLVEAYHNTSDFAEKRKLAAGANILNETIDALDSNERENDLKKIVQKNEAIKDSTSTFTKIKNFVKSIFNFFTSPFTNKSKSELDKATEETIKEFETGKNAHQQSVDKTVTVDKYKSSEVGTREQSRTPPAPPPPPPPSPSLTKPIKSAQMDNSRTPPAPPPPPPPSPTNADFKPIANQQALMAAIRQGANLKNAADRKLADAPIKSPTDPQGQMINQLEERLKARRAKFGGEQTVTPISSKFAEDAKLFEQARKEELARQARTEKQENQKVATALAAEEAAKNQEVKSKSAPLILKPGEVPPPPPPPPSISQVNKVVVKPNNTQLQKEQQQNKEPKKFAVNDEEIQKIKSKFKKTVPSPDQTMKKDEGPKQHDFRANLKKRPPER